MSNIKRLSTGMLLSQYEKLSQVDWFMSFSDNREFLIQIPKYTALNLLRHKLDMIDDVRLDEIRSYLVIELN